MKQISSDYYKGIGFEKKTRSYHTVFLFARQLGFDPLTFEPFNDDIFKARAYRKSNGELSFTSNYRRHHLKITAKSSLFFQDLTLTDIWTHNYWNSLSESEARGLLDRFHNLINKKGQVAKDDVIRAFSGGFEWVLNDPRTGWFKDMKKFNKNLLEFNLRKEIYRTKNGIEKLMWKRKYNNLINRFYKEVLDDKLRSMILFVKPPYSGLRDYSDFFAIDFYFKKHS